MFNSTDYVHAFSFDYPPNSGGIARLMEALVRGLSERGIRVEVITQRHPDGHVPDIDAVVSTIRVSERRPQREWQALRHLLRHRSGICISGLWYPEGVIVQLAAARARIIMAHGAELYPPHHSVHRFVWKALLQFALRRADCVIANSSFTADMVKQLVSTAHITAVPLAVDHHRFQPQDRSASRARWDVPDDMRVISTVSRVHRYKGHETVLQALARLSPEIRRSFIYLIGGTGPDIPYFQQRAEALGIADNVRWLGFVSDDDLPSLYSASDLFALMTMEIPEERSVEGFGLVFLEAQACGTPVVGARTGGIPDAISHGDGGWLLEQNDYSGLAGLLLDLQRNPKMIQEMGAKARQRVEREFTWDHYLDRFLVALESAGIRLGVG